jgi:hypothetical protein
MNFIQNHLKSLTSNLAGEGFCLENVTIRKLLSKILINKLVFPQQII